MESYDIDTATAEEIMTHHVIMLEDSATFEELISKLYDHDITAVFIHQESTNQYFKISQKDIVQFLRLEGLYLSNLKSTKISQFLTKPVELIDVNMPVDKIIHFMTQNNEKRVLIAERGIPVGVVSTKDLLIWNNTYFKAAKPQVLLFMDNQTSNFVAQYIFEENVDNSIQRDLIDLYGGALNSISLMTDEILTRSGKLCQFIKDNRCVLFEPEDIITGILICDYNSIDLRCKLQKATKFFCTLYEEDLHSKKFQGGVCKTFKIEPILPIFGKI